jgi:hypothetical protein
MMTHYKAYGKRRPRLQVPCDLSQLRAIGGRDGDGYGVALSLAHTSYLGQHHKSDNGQRVSALG